MKLKFPQLNIYKRTWLAILAVVVLALGFSFFFFRKDSPQAEASWWDEGWYYRKSIDVGNSTSTLTDFQVKILHNQDLSTDIANGKIKSDLADLRFTDTNGKILNYWIEDNTTTSVDVWVKIPTLTYGTSTYYMYYGNPGAESLMSNGSEIFDFFDEFKNINNNTYQDITGTNSIVNEGHDNYALSTGVDDNDIRFFTKQTFGTNYAVRTRLRNPGTDGGIFFDTQNDSGGYLITFRRGGGVNAFQWYSRTGGSWTSISSHNNFASWTDTTYRVLDIKRNNANLSATIDDINIDYTVTTSSLYSNGGVGMRGYGAGGYQVVDWILVRKSVVQEPVTSAPSSEEKGPGPIAYWSLDEGYGTTANDYTPNANHGTITSATWKDSYECIKGKCLYFDGTNDFVQFGSSTITGTSPFTISAWLKPGDHSNYGLAFYMGAANSSQSAWLGWTANAQVGTSNSFGGGFYGNNFGSGVVGNDWHFVTLSFSGGSNGTVSLYIDGLLKASDTYTPNLSATSIFMGKANSGTAYWYRGYINEVKVYNYARSADQIRQDYNKGFSIALGQADQYNSLSDGLVGWWPMDEISWNGTAGEVKDNSGNGYNGTSANANTTSTAKFGRAGEFDGGTKYILIGDTPAFDFGKNDFTLSVWAYLDSDFSTWDTSVLAKWNSGSSPGTNEWYLGIAGTTNGSDLKPGFSFESGNTVYKANSPDDITLDEWHHVIAMRQGTYLRLYVDGIEKANTFIGDITVNNISGRTLKIAKIDGGTYGIKGKVDDVRIYNRSLSPDEVRRLYEWAPEPVGYWKFDEGNGQNIFSSVAATGTVGQGYLGSSISVESNDPTWEIGKYGSALKFDAANSQRAYIPDPGTDSIYDFKTGDSITLSLWVKPSAFTTEDGLLGKGSGYNENYGLALSNASPYDKPLFFFRRDNETGWSYYRATSDSFVLNEWSHVAVTYTFGSSTSIKMYLNGALIPGVWSQGTGDEAPDNDDSGIYIGYLNYTGEQFNGWIDEVKIYNYTRNPRQILEDMNAGRQNNPIAYWSFDEGQGSYANDYSGYNHKGTLGCSGSGCSLPEWTTGVRNSAMYTDPATTTEKQCVSLSTGKLNIASSTGTPVSISLWLNASTTQIGGGWILRNGQGTDENYSMILVASGGKYRVKLEGYDGVTFRSGTSNGAYITPGEWTHVVMIYKQGIGFDLYINSVFKETVSYPYVNLTGSSFAIACGGANIQSYSGYIDELKIYLYDLTMDEIRKDYNFGLQNVLSKPVANTQNAPTSSLAYWKFDDMSGTTAVDSSGNGYNGTLGGSPTWTVEGQRGGALYFDGVGNNDYVDITNYAVTTMTNQPYTFSAWIKPQFSVGDKAIVGKNRSYTHYGLGLKLSTSTLYALAANNNSEWFTNLNYDISAYENQWIHVAFSIGGLSGTQTGKLYVNGRKVDEYTGTASYYSPYPFFIGAGKSTNVEAEFSGMIDDVKLFNYVLSDRDIAMEYNGGAPVGYWSFDEGEGQTVLDRSGNGNNGTLIVGSGGTQTTTSTAWTNGAAGKINGSLNFDGTDDKVNLGSVTTGENVSISSWIKTTNGNQRPIFSNRGSGVYYGISGGKFFIYDNGASPVPNMNSNKTINDGNWHHVVWTSNGSSSVMYIDGELDSVLVQSRLSDSGTAYVAWDAANGTEYFPGQIDELKIWNYALTTEEIKQEYNGGFSSFFR